MSIVSTMVHHSDDNDSLYDFNCSSQLPLSLPASRGSGRSVKTAISRLGSSPLSLGRSVASRAFDRSDGGGVSVASNSIWTTHLNNFNDCNDDSKEWNPREVASDMENQINALLGEIARLSREGKKDEALDRAKEACKKEDSLKKYRKLHSLAMDEQFELTFAVWFSVASCYQINDMMDEAIMAYALIAKLREHPLAGQARINLGNIYYAKHDYAIAIKNYKMALDLASPGDREIMANIRCNIANAYFHKGQMRDAIKNFEDSMNASPNHQAGFNLLVCHLALGDYVSMKHDFLNLLKISSDSDSEDVGEDAGDVENLLLNAARLVAPSMGSTEMVETLKANHEGLAMKMTYEQAVDLLKKNDMKRAVKMLTTLEKHSPELKAMVATNLSFVRFLQGDIGAASHCADIALDANRYNHDALINKGNCFFANGDFASAKTMYLEALSVRADCAQAIFNLGLADVRLSLPNKAVKSFEKLHSITPNNPTAIYHIADVYENQGKLQEAIRWFSVLSSNASNDSVVLARLAHLFSRTKDSTHAVNYNLESFRHFPVDLDVIAGIGAFFVQQEMFEKAIYFFQQAALLQPKEIKWSLMIASAHRRLDDQASALKLFKKLHHEFPTNVECLRSLVMMCKSMKEPYYQYQERLENLIET